MSWDKIHNWPRISEFQYQHHIFRNHFPFYFFAVSIACKMLKINDHNHSCFDHVRNRFFLVGFIKYSMFFQKISSAELNQNHCDYVRLLVPQPMEINTPWDPSAAFAWWASSPGPCGWKRMFSSLMQIFIKIPADVFPLFEIFIIRSWFNKKLHFHLFKLSSSKKIKFPGVISLRKLFSIAAIPNGTL